MRPVGGWGTLASRFCVAGAEVVSYSLGEWVRLEAGGGVVQLEVVPPVLPEEDWRRPHVLLLQDGCDHDLFWVTLWAEWLGRGGEWPAVGAGAGPAVGSVCCCTDRCVVGQPPVGPFRPKLLVACPEAEEEYAHRWLSLIRSICDENGVEFSVLGREGQPSGFNRYLANPKRGCCRLPSQWRSL